MEHPNDLFPSHMVLYLECGLLVLFVLWATMRVAGDAALPGIRSIRWLERLSKSPRLPRSVLGLALVLALLGLLGNAAITAVMGFPNPGIDDARAYQITADTFAAGRMTNPAPPHPALVSEQVLATPTYNGKYPPGQGLFLVFGTWLGQPGLSLWLGSALLPAIFFWCLSGWLPRRWALAGALLLLLRLAVGSYWNHTYWGGTVAAIGSALLLGGLGRRALASTSTALRSPWALGVGLGVLATSRPYEGFAVALPVLVWLGIRVFRSPGPARRRAAGEIAAILACAAPWVVFLGFYNWSVGGSVYPFPHQVYEQHRPVAGEFLWDRWVESRGTAVWTDLDRSPEDRRGWWRAAMRLLVHRAVTAPYFLIGPTLLLAVLLALPRSRRQWLLGISVLLVILAHSLVGFHFPHYSAPMTAHLWILGILALRSMTLRPPSRFRQASWLLIAVFTIELISFVFQLPALRAHPSEPFVRQIAIERDLKASGEAHLIFVEYQGASLLNGRDFQAPVLWAYDYGAESTRELLEFFPERRLWFFDPAEPELIPLDRRLLLERTYDPESYRLGPTRKVRLDTVSRRVGPRPRGSGPVRRVDAS